MKKLIFILQLICILAFAVDSTQDLHLQETGQFFVLKIIPGKKQTQFYITGHKAVEIDLNKLQINASYLFQGKEKTISLTRRGDHFISNSSLVGKELQFEIKDEAAGKTDQLKFKLKKP